MCRKKPIIQERSSLFPGYFLSQVIVCVIVSLCVLFLFSTQSAVLYVHVELYASNIWISCYHIPVSSLMVTVAVSGSKTMPSLGMSTRIAVNDSSSSSTSSIAMGMSTHRLVGELSENLNVVPRTELKSTPAGAGTG